MMAPGQGNTPTGQSNPELKTMEAEPEKPSQPAVEKPTSDSASSEKSTTLVVDSALQKTPLSLENSTAVDAAAAESTETGTGPRKSEVATEGESWNAKETLR